MEMSPTAEAEITPSDLSKVYDSTKYRKDLPRLNKLSEMVLSEDLPIDVHKDYSNGKSFEDLKMALRKDGTTMRIREEIAEQKTLDCLIGLREWEVKE